MIASRSVSAGFAWNLQGVPRQFSGATTPLYLLSPRPSSLLSKPTTVAYGQKYTYDICASDPSCNLGARVVWGSGLGTQVSELVDARALPSRCRVDSLPVPSWAPSLPIVLGEVSDGIQGQNATLRAWLFGRRHSV